MRKTNYLEFNAQAALRGIIGAWIVSVLIFIFSALRNGSGAIGALTMASIATGILSSYALNALAKKNHNGAGFHPFLLVANAILTCVGCYILVSILL